MARGHPHDPKIKGAVLAALLAGHGVEQVAAEFNIPEPTVKGWSKQLRHKAVETGLAREEEQTSYAALVDTYLREALTSLGEHQKFIRQGDWLKRQSASDIAVLHGVVCDKVLRILEAMERAACARIAAASPGEGEVGAV